MLRLTDQSHHDGTILGDRYAAFTVAELGEMLPPEIKDKKFQRFVHGWKDTAGEYWIGYADSTLKFESRLLILGRTEADARAKMLVYLIESKLIAP